MVIDYAQHIGKQTVFIASAFVTQEIMHSKNAQCNKMESPQQYESTALKRVVTCVPTRGELIRSKNNLWGFGYLGRLAIQQSLVNIDTPILENRPKPTFLFYFILLFAFSFESNEELSLIYGFSGNKDVELALKCLLFWTVLITVTFSFEIPGPPDKLFRPFESAKLYSLRFGFSCE